MIGIGKDISHSLLVPPSIVPGSIQQGSPSSSIPTSSIVVASVFSAIGAAVIIFALVYIRRRLLHQGGKLLSAPGPGPDTCLVVTDIQDSTHHWWVLISGLFYAVRTSFAMPLIAVSL